MTTKKVMCCVYDCKKHEMKIVEKELQVYSIPAKPSPDEVRIKKICDVILEIVNAINNLAKKDGVSVSIDTKFVEDYINNYNKKYGGDIVKALRDLGGGV